MNLGSQLGGYPGRGLIVHVDPAGQLGWLYFVTGRSESSRNRQAVRLDDGTLAVAPVSGAADAPDPLRHYVCARPVADGLVIGNGDHVGTIADRIGAGADLAAAIGDLEPEPDPPINTPRIAAVVTNEPYLAAVCSTPDGISLRVQPVRLTPGTATVLTTYAGDAADPGGSAPLAVAPAEGSLRALTDDVWNALDPDLRVLLLTSRTATLDDVTLISTSSSQTI